LRLNKTFLAFALIFIFSFSLIKVDAANSFSDVLADSPYYNAVMRLKSLDIVSGKTDGTYGINDPVTRAMMVVFINRISGYRQEAEKYKYLPPAFKDVPKNYWAIGDINLAAKLDFTSGIGNGLFNPNGKVTYVQALGFVLNVLGYKNLKWPEGVLGKAKEIGLTGGISLNPDDTVKRGELALILNKALDCQLITSK